jgi:hypothetical protein
MPRQFGKVDVSASWPPCQSCPHRHAALAPCPPSNAWLVLHFCPACSEATGLYCRTHRDRHMPSGDAHHTVPEPAEDGRMRAAGERSEG